MRGRKLRAWVGLCVVLVGLILLMTTTRPNPPRGITIWFGLVCAWGVIRLVLIYKYSSPDRR